MKAKELAGSAWKRLRINRRWILKRLLGYFLILVMMSPIILIYRTEIYRGIISRYDDWVYYYTEDGIPVIDYGYQAGAYVGDQSTPRIVANEAINYYLKMQEGNATAEVYFNNTIDWLVDRSTTLSVTTNEGNVELAHWFFDFAIWELPEGWHQSMADAKGIHALALAYSLYGNHTYLDLINRTVASFEVLMSLGGNVLILDDGTNWYPEYIVRPSIDPNYTPSMILNGFLIALRHLNDANKILNSTRISEVFDKGVESAAENIEKYDSPYNWTLYHLDYPQKFASRKYHQIHINEARYLYEETGIAIFQYYADRWETYTGPPSMTIEELLSPEFLYYGAVVGSILLGTLIGLDALQLGIRNYLRKRETE